MIGSFYDIFDKTPDKGSEVPQVVLDVLSNQLPSNLGYYRTEDGNYIVGPKPGCQDAPLLLGIELAPDFVAEHFKNIPEDKWVDYIYRMQLKVPLKNAMIGNEEKKIPIEEITGHPLHTQVKMKEAYIIPKPFPEAKDMNFETEEGDKIVLSIKRMPYDSLNEEFFTNINFKGIKFQFYIDENNKTSRVTYAVTPTKADTVDDALAALHLFNGLYKGTVKINGTPISGPVVGKEQVDSEKIEELTKFWEKAKALEERLMVSFIPSAEFPMDDQVFFSQLDRCLLHGKDIVWKHPFDHFHASGINLKEGNIQDFFGKGSMEFVFLEGPIQATLLGAEFELYSDTKLRNMVMTNIEWDDDNKDSGEIYVSDPVGDTWMLSRRYMTEADRDKWLEEQEKTKSDSVMSS